MTQGNLSAGNSVPHGGGGIQKNTIKLYQYIDQWPIPMEIWHYINDVLSFPKINYITKGFNGFLTLL